MKICVLIKQVPDKNSSLTITEDQRSLEENNITWVSNESDTYALEEALLIKEAHGGEVIACTLGGESAGQVLKDAMAKDLKPEVTQAPKGWQPGWTCRNVYSYGWRTYRNCRYYRHYYGYYW